MNYVFGAIMLLLILLAKVRYSPRTSKSKGLQLEDIPKAVKGVGFFILYMMCSAIPMTLSIIGEGDEYSNKIPYLISVSLRACIFLYLLYKYRTRAKQYIDSRHKDSAQISYIAMFFYYYSMFLLLIPAGLVLTLCGDLLQWIFFAGVTAGLLYFAFAYLPKILLYELMSDKRLGNLFIGIYLYVLIGVVGIMIMNLGIPGQNWLSAIMFFVGAYYLLRNIALVHVLLLDRCPHCHTMDSVNFVSREKSHVERDVERNISEDVHERYNDSLKELIRTTTTKYTLRTTWQQIYKDRYTCPNCGAKWSQLEKGEILEQQTDTRTTEETERGRLRNY